MNIQSNRFDTPSVSNRLVGWLVSYSADELGAAHEIRSGRSFISSQESGPDRVMAVVDSTVSAPHLALKATPKHRVMVQDIFSDHGSYIVRGDSQKEYPITGPTEIKHGDWIRVGQKIRFQVCLIDGPTR